jgi:hypothetical protein
MGDPLSSDEGHDPRYLAGVLFFNRGEYFDAHEVWEHLWQNCDAADRRFYQGLIQVAVALYHAIRGNRVGASRLSESGHRYLELYPPGYRGFAREPFWEQVQAALAPFLDGRTDTLALSPETAPRIEIDPPVNQWPNPEAVLHATEEQSDA